MPMKTTADLLADIKQRRPDLLPPDYHDPGARLPIDVYRAGGRFVSEPTAGPPVGPPVMARVDHGRWIGDCDLQDPLRRRVCRGAQYLHLDDHRFFCCTCNNQATDGRWRLVVWPANRAAVETPLDGLPPREQNWRP